MPLRSGTRASERVRAFSIHLRHRIPRNHGEERRWPRGPSTCQKTRVTEIIPLPSIDQIYGGKKAANSNFLLFWKSTHPHPHRAQACTQGMDHRDNTMQHVFCRAVGPTRERGGRRHVSSSLLCVTGSAERGLDVLNAKIFKNMTTQADRGDCATVPSCGRRYFSQCLNPHLFPLVG